MYKCFVFVILSACITGLVKAQDVDYAIQPVDFNQVHLRDKFWAPKIEINRKVSIPSAFGKSEETGRVDNFALAGGIIEGEHQGDFPFDDTDIYKILEGASYALSVEYDKKLDRYLDSLINYIDAAQEKDGYLFTCVTNKCERLKRWYGEGRWDRLNSHELYNSGHLYEAAVAHYKATGKRSLLDIAIKNAELVYKDFGPNEGQKHVPSGHPIIEMALVRLYHVTGEKKYLDLAEYFIDETGKATDGHELSQYSQDHMPVIDQEEAVGHAVRFGYLYSGVTDVAALTQNQKYIDALDKLWNNVVSKKLYITGGIGARDMGEGFGENYELPNMTAYCETCAAISNVYWNHRMFLLKGNSKYYDVLERTLYNGVISGVSLSGDKFFYDNPLESDGSHDREEWFGCACCPGNITRFMASVPGYQYAVNKEGIYVNLFIEGETTLEMNNKGIQISQKTNYPWDGNVSIKIDENKAGKFKLKIRIPGWAQNKVVDSDLYYFVKSEDNGFKAELNGNPIANEIENGYLIVAQDWKKGDVVNINFPMPVRKIRTIENVVNNRDKVALQRGPIVYCLEQADNPGAYLFDFMLKPTQEIEAKFEPELLNGVVSLSLKGQKQVIKNNKRSMVVASLKAIPYYAWNNRGANKMLVWIPENEKALINEPLPSVASKAHASSTIEWGTPGLNDQFEPKSSTDTDKNLFYWWLRNGTDEWVQYDFNKKQKVSSCDVYWFKFDHYDYVCRAPESWEVQYLDGDIWKPVKNIDSYATEYDTFNTVRFKPVKTKAIRIAAKLQKDFSAGIMEWKVN